MKRLAKLFRRALPLGGSPPEANSHPSSPAAELILEKPARQPIRLLATHHSAFRHFAPWVGTVSAGFSHTFSGSMVRTAFHAGTSTHEHTYLAIPSFSRIDEEYFEWVDLIEAVADAKQKFVIAELGAGYGRWAVAGAMAARRFRPDLKVFMIAVEAEPTHFAMLQQHFLDNGIDPTEHRLIEAAVNDTGGEVSFTIGHAKEWYGQSIIQPGAAFGNWPEGKEVRVRAVTLDEVLIEVEYVDLLDMDVQGAEETIVASSLLFLNSHVRRLHIGTHSHAIEDGIYKLLINEGWHCIRAYRSSSIATTEFGDISFQDGVQSWINPRLHQYNKR